MISKKSRRGGGNELNYISLAVAFFIVLISYYAWLEWDGFYNNPRKVKADEPIIFPICFYNGPNLICKGMPTPTPPTN